MNGDISRNGTVFFGLDIRRLYVATGLYPALPLMVTSDQSRRFSPDALHQTPTELAH
jgi:hypothetical protein